MLNLLRRFFTERPVRTAGEAPSGNVPEKIDRDEIMARIAAGIVAAVEAQGSRMQEGMWERGSSSARSTGGSVARPTTRGTGGVSGNTLDSRPRSVPSARAMLATPSKKPSSPCTKICVLDAVTGLCEGCGRTRDEIGLWGSLPEAQRLAIMAVLPERLRRAYPERETRA